ncbi:MAG: histidinol-phosphatase [Chitinivibrionales bacterium]|nr:histidinol-phosphatase [Chitinivibrionales bacterium]
MDHQNRALAYLCDYHIHTPYCKHAEGAIIEYVDVALRKGMNEICFTDHLGRYYLTPSQRRRYWDWGMAQRSLNRYIDELEQIKKTYKDAIVIKMGLEIDYIEGAEELVQPLIQQFPFDFLIGSIHCLPLFGWKHIAHYTTYDPYLLFSEYFRVAQAAIASKLFDSLGHLDFIWRYGQWPQNESSNIYEWIDQTVKAAAQHDCAIEINSNGYLWSQMYTVETGDPFECLMQSIKKQRTIITVGSDAHRPDFVAKSFPDIHATLTMRGISECAIFNKRKKSLVSFLAPNNQ